MRAKLAVSIGLLFLLSTASDGSAAKWFGSGGSSDGNSGRSFGQQVSKPNNNNNQNSVAEPSSLYGVGTALLLLGGAGWLLRRK